jgi:hypothetical protein
LEDHINAFIERCGRGVTLLLTFPDNHQWRSNFFEKSSEKRERFQKNISGSGYIFNLYKYYLRSRASIRLSKPAFWSKKESGSTKRS